MPHHLQPSPVFRFRDLTQRAEFVHWRNAIRAEGKGIAFTNGVFDLLHKGHTSYLLEARNLGDVLVVGLNADSSVRRLKGDTRPIQNEEDRAYILASLKACDCVVIFDEDTPLDLIAALVPDILVKGGDYKIEDIVGKDIVESNGGVVKTIPLVEGKSTTGIVEKMKQR